MGLCRIWRLWLHGVKWSVKCHLASAQGFTWFRRFHNNCTELHAYVHLVCSCRIHALVRLHIALQAPRISQWLVWISKMFMLMLVTRWPVTAVSWKWTCLKRSRDIEYDTAYRLHWICDGGCWRRCWKSLWQACRKDSCSLLESIIVLRENRTGFCCAVVIPGLMWKGATDIDAIAAIPADQYEAEMDWWGLMGWWFWRYQHTVWLACK